MLSVIIPFFNEKENLTPLFEELHGELSATKLAYEIVFVDDGSTDGSANVILELKKHNSTVQLKRFSMRRGKGYALQAGIKESTGDLVAFMDADMQDDSSDIHHFLKKINDGYDLVNGIRARKDSLLIRFYSKMGNAFLRSFVRSPLTDINCGFKLMRREVLDTVPFYSNNFRFLPIAAHYKGFRVGEVPVHNRPRKFGKSKFGIGKVFIGFIDTITAFFLYEFSERPLHFFGMIGGFFFLAGFLVTVYMTYERLFFGVLLYRRPALQFAILFIVVGIQVIMTGFIGELIVYMNKKNSKL